MCEVSMTGQDRAWHGMAWHGIAGRFVCFKAPHAPLPAATEQWHAKVIEVCPLMKQISFLPDCPHAHTCACAHTQRSYAFQPAPSNCSSFWIVGQGTGQPRNTLGFSSYNINPCHVGLFCTQGYRMQRASLGIHPLEQLHCQMWGWHSQQAGAVHGKRKQ